MTVATGTAFVRMMVCIRNNWIRERPTIAARMPILRRLRMSSPFGLPSRWDPRRGLRQRRRDLRTCPGSRRRRRAHKTSRARHRRHSRAVPLPRPESRWWWRRSKERHRSATLFRRNPTVLADRSTRSADFPNSRVTHETGRAGEASRCSRYRSIDTTRRLLVLPAWPNGMPATTTRISRTDANPWSIASAVACSTISS